MGKTMSTLKNEELKSIEYQIFDKSFAMIEKYVKTDTKGIRDAFNREYEWVLINEGDGDLNWHKIVPKHMNRHSTVSSYIQAIQIVGQMIKEAEHISKQSNYCFTDKPKFRQIYRLVDSLIDLIEDQQKVKTSMFCCVSGNSYEFQNQVLIKRAWDIFRYDHD